MRRHIGTLTAGAAEMLRALREQQLLWPAVATLLGIAALIGLGNWQMQRLAWKEGLIAAIAERTHLPPVPLDEEEKLATAVADVE